MFIQELTVEQRLERNLNKIIMHDRYAPLAQVIMIGTKEVCETTPTACTNGRDELYGREFCAGLGDPDFRGLILHENKHKAYRHIDIWKYLWVQDADLANQSMDYVINLEIIDENPDGFATLPEGGCIDERFRGMDTAQVFDILYKEKQEGGGGGGGEGFDSHDWEGAASMSDEEQQALAEEVQEAIQQGLLLAGKQGIDTPRGLVDLVKPQVDWREVMREFIKTTTSGGDMKTFRRPNRRLYSQGFYMPSSYSEAVGDIVYAGDMSGSIGKAEQAVVLTEGATMCKEVNPNKLHVLYWDTEVRGHEEYTTDQLDRLVDDTKPVGGGGTDVECVSQYISDKNIDPVAAIILTDGYFYRGWGTWTCPVLWVIVDNKDAVPPTGKCIHVKARQLR